jgi:bifunctional DNA-binding transcriptional regulator/antitoxin component of YhaV-PrlF toxin-antitoxin module
MATNTKIQKISSKGQVTLPASWRKAIKTEHISVVVVGDRLEITPARFDNDGEYTVFDAIRDNGGKGLKVRDLQKILTKLG